MSTDRQRATAIFLAASERPSGDRAAFVQQACGGDPDLLRETLSLLEAHAGAGPLDRLAGDLQLPDLYRLFRRPAPGDRFGPYEVIEELGRGGMGIVFKARNVRLDRLAALKLLPAHLALDDETRARFVAEARAASALDHPNICTIYDAGEHEGRLYLAMACYEGETLEDRIARGPLSVEDAVGFAVQAADGLAEAHRRGIVHRDIKPGNLMVIPSGTLKILDFGIATTAGGEAARAGASPGTVAYMSPEQARGEAVDQRTDLWALGVVLYEALTGVRPFRGSHEPAVLHALLYEDPEPVHRLRRDVPPAVEQVVRRALARDPAMRYQHAGELRGDLQRPRIALAPTPHQDRPEPGTLTFFFSDVEGSTRLLHQVGDGYAGILVDLRRLLRDALLERGGREVDTAGDGFFAVFNRAHDAVAAAAAVQRAVHAHAWPDDAAVRLRIGLHTGEPAMADGSYVGLDVHRAARICSVAHGGQVLLSRATADLVQHHVPEGVSLLDVGLHALKDLPEPEPLFQLDIAGLPDRFPALGTRTERVRNLPAQLTSFVGRRREVDRLQALLRTARLVTLTGPGGTGKTRLSLAAAAGLADAFDDGVVFVSLAPVADPALVPTAVAQALELRENPGQPVAETIKRFLQRRRMLLVLDNFEQVLAAAPFVAELLAACPALAVLVTSRAPLHLSGEQEFPVPPLELPDRRAPWTPEGLAQQEAVALFLDRARAVRPDFVLTPEAARAVAEICLRLDGLPLAIELAAARVKVLSPIAIQLRLGRCFQLLTGGALDRPARHQTLWQTIAWSYDLLGPNEQAFFRRLSVFRGGCTLEAAGQVCMACSGLEQVCSGCGDPALEALDAMATLVDRSLLRQEESPDGEPRFYMLETIREYGMECLRAAGEDAPVRRAHAEYFLALAERAEPELTGPQPGAWLDLLEAEHDNLRAALSWAEANDAAVEGLRLGTALWRFWIVRGHLREGRERLERLLALPAAAAPTRERAKALNGLGTIIHEISDFTAARPPLQESLEIWRALGDRHGVATALLNLGWVACQMNEFALARSRSEEGRALCLELDDRRGVAVALHNLTYVAFQQGRFAEAAATADEGLACRRAAGDRRGYAYELATAAWAEGRRGLYEQAMARLEEALSILTALHDNQLIAWTLTVKGEVVHDRGDLEQAAAVIAESVALWREVGNRRGLSFALPAFGHIQRDRGRPDEAARLFEECQRLGTEMRVPWDVARALYGLGCLAGDGGAHDRAMMLYAESLKRRRSIGDQAGIVECLEGIGRLHARQGDWPGAVQLCGAAAALREEIDFAVPRRYRAAYARFVEEACAALGDERFERNWSEGSAMAPEQVIAARLPDLL